MQAFDDIGRPDAPHGSRDWAARARLSLKNDLDNAKQTVSAVQARLQIYRDNRFFEKLQDAAGGDFTSWEAFCEAPWPHGLGFPAEVANAIIAETDGNRLIADVVGRFKAAPAAAPTGRPPKGTTVVPLSKGGTDRLIGRIKRDHPDIAAAVERGEFPSIKAAARAAGIVKPPNALNAMKRAWERADDEERAAFIDWIGGGA